MALVGLVVVPLLAACGGRGFHAETNEIYQPGPGITDRDSSVYALNALIVSDGGSNGTLVTALINQGPKADTLESVTAKNTVGHPLQTTIVGGSIPLPVQRSVQLAQSGDVRIDGALLPGTYCSVTLTFRDSAPVDFQIPVLTKAAASDYSDVPVGPAPTTPSHSNP